MINVQEFARRLSTLGPEAFTSDDVVDLATAADVRISADLEIDATVAQRLLDQISPTLPVTGAQSLVITGSGSVGGLRDSGSVRRRPMMMVMDQ